MCKGANFRGAHRIPRLYCQVQPGSTSQFSIFHRGIGSFEWESQHKLNGEETGTTTLPKNETSSPMSLLKKFDPVPVDETLCRKTFFQVKPSKSCNFTENFHLFRAKHTSRLPVLIYPALSYPKISISSFPIHPPHECGIPVVETF